MDTLVFEKRLGPRAAAISSIMLLACVSAAGFAGSYQEPLITSLGSDTLITISRALADIRPSFYENDFLFSLPQNYKLYNNMTVYFFEFVALFREVPIGWEYRIFSALVNFVHLLGWYLLGFRLFGSRVLSLIFSLMVAIAVPTTPGDYWGLHAEPQARVQFAALLPYMILSAINAHSSAPRWLLTFFITGISMWLHPASAPPVALAILLSMFVVSCPIRGVVHTLFLAVPSGLIFLLIAVPNFLQYYAVVAAAPAGADLAAAKLATALRYSDSYLNAVEGVKTTLGRAFSGPRLALPLVGLASATWLTTRYRGKFQDTIFVLIFGGILFLFAGLVPIVDQYVSSLTGRPPMQMDIVRSLRYLIPVLAILAFLGVSSLPNIGFRSVIAVAILGYWFLAALWVAPRYQSAAPIGAGVRCWLGGHIVCPETERQDAADLLDFVRTTPKGTRFFAPENGLMIRSFGLRPLAFDWKDVGWLAYSNHKMLGSKLPVIEEYARLAKLAPGPATNDLWLAFGKRVEADYIVVEGDPGPRSRDLVDRRWGDIIVYRLTK